MRKTLGLMLIIGWGVCCALSDEQTTILRRLNDKMPAFQAQKVSQTPMAGLYEVKNTNHQIIYTDKTGRYVLAAGELLDLEQERHSWNLTESSRMTDRRPLLHGLRPEEMITYGPITPKAVVTVFTDHTCHYCRRFHQELSKLEQLGIQVRYVPFPRAGINSPSYTKLVAVWCHENPAQAMTDILTGKDITSTTCQHPVERLYQLGRRLNVRGTPSLFFSDGTMAPGYMPAEQVAQQAIEHSR